MTAAAPATDPHLAFRATIADAPDAEGPKLVYADFLDEQGDPAAFEWRAKVHRARIATAPDDMQPRLEFAALCDAYGDCEQAEFLRVGCELAGMPDEITTGNRCPLCNRSGVWRKGVHFDHEKICFHGGDNDLSWEPGETIRNPTKQQAQARSTALLARHGATWARAWLGDVFPDVSSFFFSANGIIADTDDDGTATLIPSWSWHAGAPADFKVPTMAAWRGRTVGVHPHDGGPEHDRLVGGLGAAIVRACPVRYVELGDKSPNTPPDRLPYWFNAIGIPPTQICEHDLPPDLFARLEGWTEAGNDRMAGYPTAALARAALARVLIAEAWNQPVPKEIRCSEHTTRSKP